MRWLILSDIHGNWDALQAVLADAAGDYDSIICCGDLVDYGAEPNEVVHWVRGHVKHVIRGNHDRVCAGLGGIEDFSPIAQCAALWTHENLTAENFEYLEQLPQGPVPLDGFVYCHGALSHEDDYLITLDDARDQRGRLETPVTIFGHTHAQGGFLVLPHAVRRIGQVARGSDEAILEIQAERWYLLNPGAVGQPRDGDPRAAYAIFSPDDRAFAFRRVEYEVKRAAMKIIRAGLPDRLAGRLLTGD
ncbi:MAG: metallophosphoesterase family protein [Bryobacteraceae bacterium]